MSASARPSARATIGYLVYKNLCTFNFDPENKADVIYQRSEHKNFENRLPFELQCWVNTHFEGFVELSSLLINV